LSRRKCLEEREEERERIEELLTLDVKENIEEVKDTQLKHYRGQGHTVRTSQRSRIFC